MAQQLDKIGTPSHNLADRDSLNLASEISARKSYPVKFRSREAYDGLVGYFPAKESPDFGDGLDLECLYTRYHNSEDSITKPIDDKAFPE